MLREKHLVPKFMVASQISMLAMEYKYTSQGVKMHKIFLQPYPEVKPLPCRGKEGRKGK
jgi:hypothetical protein